MVSWHLEESGHTSTSLEYMDDENDTDDGDGVGQVKKEDEGFRARRRSDTHQHQLVTPNKACTTVCWFGSQNQGCGVHQRRVLKGIFDS